MTFDEYQEFTRSTVIYPEAHRHTYPALGLASEVGEVVGKIKRCLRDGVALDKSAGQRDLALELGDVLWYVARLADEYEISLDDIVCANVSKLTVRLYGGTLRGSGDHR